MQIERVERLKQEYTDRYVVADASRPELARFKGQVGQIKTINFNGRALVQFDADNNRGWYDIDLDFLKIVDKPEPKPEVVKPAAAAKASASKEAGKKEPVKKEPAAKKEAAGQPVESDPPQSSS